MIKELNNKGSLVAGGKRNGKLYELIFQLNKSMEAANSVIEEDVQLWHKRLGHLGKESMTKLIRNDMIEEMVISVNDIQNSHAKDCEVCIQGKQTKLPFHKHKDKSTKRPLEVIHSDVCGPITPSTWDNKGYYMTIIDDFTHFGMVFFLEHKSKVFKYFQE